MSCQGGKVMLQWKQRNFQEKLLLLWLYQSKDIPVIVATVLASNMMFSW